jgi:hypothetical protein
VAATLIKRENRSLFTLSQLMLEPIDRLMDSESAIDGVRKEKERLTAACLFFIAAAVSFPFHVCSLSHRGYLFFSLPRWKKGKKTLRKEETGESFKERKVWKLWTGLYFVSFSLLPSPARPAFSFFSCRAQSKERKTPATTGKDPNSESRARDQT